MLSKHERQDRASRPREVSEEIARQMRDGTVPGKCVMQEMQAKQDQAGGMKALPRIITDHSKQSYLRMFKFFLRVRNLEWDQIWKWEREEEWDGQLYTLYRFLPTEFTVEDMEDIEVTTVEPFTVGKPSSEEAKYWHQKMSALVIRCLARKVVFLSLLTQL